MVGELPAAELAVGSDLREGDEIVLVGFFQPSLAGSELAKLRGELGMGLPETAIEPVARALALVRELVETAPLAPPMTSATAASPPRSPRWRSRAGSAPTSTSTR